MASIQPYGLGSSPNLTPGTAGANYGPGQSFRALSSQVGQVRGQLAQADQAARNAILSPLSNLGYFVGRRLADDHAKAKSATAKKAVAQQNMLVNQAASETLFQFKTDAGKRRDDLQQQMGGQPVDAAKTFETNLKDVSEAAISQFRDQYGAQNPEAYSRFADQVRDHVLSQNDKMQSWSLNAQTDQAHTSAKQVVPNVVSQIGLMDGSVPVDQRVSRFHEMLTDGYVHLSSLDHLKGTFLDGEVEKLKKQAPMALYRNLLSTGPDDPEQQLNYLQSIKGIFEHNDKIGIPLDPADKDSVMKSYSAAETQASRNLEANLVNQNKQNVFNLSAVKSEADVYSDNADAQQRMINFAVSQRQGLIAKQKLVDKSNMSLPVKNTYMGVLTSNLDRIDSAVKDGQRNLNTIKTVQAAKDAVALAASKAADSAQAKAANAQLATFKLSAQTDSNHMVEDLHEAVKNPVVNAEKINALKGQIVSHANQMESAGLLTPSQAHSARAAAESSTIDNAQHTAAVKQAENQANDMVVKLDALAKGDANANMSQIRDGGHALFDFADKAEKQGFLTPERAKAIKERALAIGDKASWIVRDVPVAFGRWPIEGPWSGLFPEKKGGVERTKQQRVDTMNAIMGAINDLKDDDKQKQMNDLAGLTPEQNEYFFKIRNQIQKQPGYDKADPKAKTKRFDDLRNSILFHAPTKITTKLPAPPLFMPPPKSASHAPTGKPKNYLVPPPPPETPSVVPEYTTDAGQGGM